MELARYNNTPFYPLAGFHGLIYLLQIKITKDGNVLLREMVKTFH